MILLDRDQIKSLWDNGRLVIKRFKGGQRWVEGRIHKVKIDMYEKDARAHVRVENINDSGNAWELTLRRVSVFDYMKQRKPEIGQMDVFGDFLPQMETDLKKRKREEEGKRDE